MITLIYSQNNMNTISRVSYWKQADYEHSWLYGISSQYFIFIPLLPSLKTEIFDFLMFFGGEENVAFE